MTHTFNVRSVVDPFNVLHNFSGWSDEQLSEEPSVHYQPGHKAQQMGGPITKAILETLRDFTTDSEFRWSVVTVRVAKLIDATSHSPRFADRWHSDYSSLVRQQGYDLEKSCNFMVLRGPPITEILQEGQLDFAEQPGGGLEDQARLDAAVNARIAQGSLTPVPLSRAWQLVAFDCTELHRAVPATPKLYGQYRYFFRMTVLRR